jgi:hypothetical protein
VSNLPSLGAGVSVRRGEIRNIPVGFTKRERKYDYVGEPVESNLIFNESTNQSERLKCEDFVHVRCLNSV